MFPTRYLPSKICLNQYKANKKYFVYFYLRPNVENETLNAVTDSICK